MNTAEVAAKLDTTPKVLRRFLRADPTFNNAGSGGRYTFQPSDIPALKKRFSAWQDKNSSRPKNVKAVQRIAPGDGVEDMIDPALLRVRSRRQQEEIRRLAEARVDRLEEMLKAKGLHISQMNRDDWRAAPEEVSA